MNGFAEGGIIPAPEEGGGSYPIILSRGCVVVRDEALQAFSRETLAALNGGSTDVFTVSEVLAEMDEEAGA